MALSFGERFITESRCHRPLWAVALLAWCSLTVVGQDGLSIDVASIRENMGPPASFDNLRTIRVESTRLYVTNLEVEGLVANAYGITAPFGLDRFIVGWPEIGIRSKRFDIQGTLLLPEGPVSAANRRRVFLELLMTRFGFKAHTEQRPVDVYRLTVETPGRALPLPASCDGTAAPATLQDASGHPLCRSRSYKDAGRMGLHFAGPISEFVVVLSSIVRDRPIVDATGLQGAYVLDFTYGPRSYSEPGPSVATLAREQLGLRLVAATVPIDVVVIDAVQMPTPN